MTEKHHTPEQDEKLRDRLNELRSQGKTRPEIAEAMGLPLSTVKRLIRTLQVVAKHNPHSTRAVREAAQAREKPRYVALDESDTAMSKAKQILGDRMGEDHRGYLLDGRPVSSWQILKAAGLPHGNRRK